MLLKSLGINEDVVEIDDDPKIEEVHKDVIHEVLEGCGGTGKALGHDTPLIQSISGSEGGFPLIAFHNPDQVIGMLEVDLGVDPSFPRSIKKVRSEGKWVTILLGDFV